MNVTQNSNFIELDKHKQLYLYFSPFFSNYVSGYKLTTTSSLLKNEVEKGNYFESYQTKVDYAWNICFYTLPNQTTQTIPRIEFYHSIYLCDLL